MSDETTRVPELYFSPRRGIWAVNLGTHGGKYVRLYSAHESSSAELPADAVQLEDAECLREAIRGVLDNIGFYPSDQSALNEIRHIVDHL